LYILKEDHFGKDSTNTEPLSLCSLKVGFWRLQSEFRALQIYNSENAQLEFEGFPVLNQTEDREIEVLEREERYNAVQIGQLNQLIMFP
jgi:hypothetical protein